MKFIYLILAHQNPCQLRKLVDSLNTDYSTFVIHIDAKIPIFPFLHLFHDYSNGKVFFCPERKNIVWGKYSMIEATMSMIAYALKLELDADYFHLLSGQDYPVKSNNEILNFFIKHNGRNFIDFFSLPDKRWKVSSGRILYRWGMNTTHCMEYSDLEYYNSEKHKIVNIPADYNLYGGSQWWSLHKECLNYLYALYSEGNLFEAFRYAYIPDEILFQILILNSRFKESVIKNNLRYCRWIAGHPHPEIIDEDDFKLIRNSTNMLFARKFSNSQDQMIKKFDAINKRKNINRSVQKSKRNCVISAVGKTSLHKNWIKDQVKSFDLHLIVYDDSFNLFKSDADYVVEGKEFKLRLIYQYLMNNKGLINEYDYFFFPDDDIMIDPTNIDSLFSMMKEYNLDIAQPALSEPSYYFFPHTKKQYESDLRYTNFVEMMLPCFSQEALRTVLFTFNENVSGWGADYHWGKLVNYLKYNMAIIDCITAIHTRPIQSECKENVLEYRAYLYKHNLQNVRIVTL